MANRTLTYLAAIGFAFASGCDSAKDEEIVETRSVPAAAQKQTETNQEIQAPEKQQPNVEVYKRARLIADIGTAVEVTDPITGKKAKFNYTTSPGLYYNTKVKGSACRFLDNEDGLESRVVVSACELTGDGKADALVATRVEPGVYAGDQEKRAPIAAPVWAEYRAFEGLCYGTSQDGATKRINCARLDGIVFDVSGGTPKAEPAQPQPAQEPTQPAEAPATPAP